MCNYIYIYIICSKDFGIEQWTFPVSELQTRCNFETLQYKSCEFRKHNRRETHIIMMHLPSYSALSSHPTPLLLGMYGSNLLTLMSWS